MNTRTLENLTTPLLPTPPCVADEVLRIVVVAASVTHPVPWFELHGWAMGVVALGPAPKVMVAADLAEPISCRPFFQRWPECSAPIALELRPRMQRFTTRALPYRVISHGR